MGKSTVDLLDDLVTLTNQLRWLNESGQDRSRNMSLVVTNLESAEDKLRRHLQGQQ